MSHMFFEMARTYLHLDKKIAKDTPNRIEVGS